MRCTSLVFFYHFSRVENMFYNTKQKFWGG